MKADIDRNMQKPKLLFLDIYFYQIDIAVIKQLKYIRNCNLEYNRI